MSKFMNGRLSALEAYVPGEQPRETGIIKLNTNESPFPPAPGVAKAVEAAARNLRLYSDLSAKKLIALLAATYGAAENQIIVSYADTVFINRRIEGKYPNYKQLIPASYETHCLVDRSALAAAVKRASLLEHSGSQVRFSINAASQTIQLTTTQARR